MRVAFVGKSGVGKTTAAKYLSNTYGGTVLSFATELKNVTGHLFGVNPYTKTPEIRAILQKVGQAMREIAPDIWVRFLIEQIKNTTGNIFVDDIRYKNELEALRKVGFYVVWIRRSSSQLPSGLAAHRSEAGVDEVGCYGDYLIQNDKSLNDFYRQVLIGVKDLREEGKV